MTQTMRKLPVARGAAKHTEQLTGLVAHHDSMADAMRCRKEGIFDIARGRTGWLVVFCIGLLVAAVVVSDDYVELATAAGYSGKGASYVSFSTACSEKHGYYQLSHHVCHEVLLAVAAVAP